MLKVEFEYSSNLEGMDERIRLAVANKLTELTQVLHNKVMDNVSGKLLQKQSGQLSGSIQQTVETAGEPMIGSVFPEPASPKARALEKGGEKSYDIYPVKGQFLKFITKSGETVFAKHVLHPPSREFAYLRSALEEMASLVPVEFHEAIEQAIEGDLKQ